MLLSLNSNLEILTRFDFHSFIKCQKSVQLSVQNIVQNLNFKHFPSRYHWTTGVGLPVTTAISFTGCPCLEFVFSSRCLKSGGAFCPDIFTLYSISLCGTKIFFLILCLKSLCYKSVTKFVTRDTYEKKRKKGPVVFSSLEATD